MKKKGNAGFTLIEIIVSLAIIGLLAVIFLPVFTMTVKGIFTAGNKNIATFQAQDDVENDIGGENILVKTPTEMVIIFDGIDPLEVDGNDVTSGSLEYFIPD